MTLAQKARVVVAERSGGWCEAHVRAVCTVEAVHVHHVVLRSRGGSDDQSNLLHVCDECHRWIHANPASATALGLMKSLPPKEQP